MTDSELYMKAKYYGANALLWRRKFMGLLPEIDRRRIYERKGFGSIFEFAFKLAGLSEQQVRTALNLEKRFESLPALKNLLETGEVSINKLIRIQSIATTQNEMELAEAVKILPQTALETLVRDEKQNGLFEPQIEAKSLRAQDLELGQTTLQKLLELKQKGINLDALLQELLEKRDQEIAAEKATISENLPETQSRHIPARTQRALSKEYGTKCSIRTCFKPAEHIHHTQTFALSRSHDPHYLAPLCKDHHTIAHAINLKVQKNRAMG